MTGFFRYAQLGAASGLRTATGSSQLTRHLADLQREREPLGGIADFLTRSSVRRILSVAMVGEMIADKLPFAPDRTDPGPLAGRAVFGALAGSVLAELRQESVARGALIGATGAVVGAFAGYHARRLLTRRAHLPDFAIALCEDALAIAAARHALRA
jgi:uncharacterized membrane protein